MQLSKAIALALLFVGLICLGQQPRAYWQSRDQTRVGVASYSGPGDVVSGANVFVSCARAYNLTYANGTNSLCDLVDTTTGAVAICTLRVLTTGFVDLTGNYCTGSTTPTLACAAAAGGACRVSKGYNQVSPGTNDFTNATNSSRPALTFNALGGLPGMTCTNAAASALTSTGNITSTSPWSFVAVSIRTGSTGVISGAFAENASGSVVLGYPASVNQATFTNGATTESGTASDNAFHDLIGTTDPGAGSILSVDGSSAATGINFGNLNTTPKRICRSANGTVSMDGTVMEVGEWPSAVNAATLSANIHSAANGYNF